MLLIKLFVTNDRDWESDHQDSRYGTHSSNDFSKSRHRSDVTVSNLLKIVKRVCWHLTCHTVVIVIKAHQ